MAARRALSLLGKVARDIHRVEVAQRIQLAAVLGSAALLLAGCAVGRGGSELAPSGLGDAGSGSSSGSGSGTRAGTSSGSSSGSASGGGSGFAGDAGPGAPCDPAAVVDVCAPGGLVCDGTRRVCRLPGAGEQCSLSVGCASTPANLGCYQVALSGTPETVCLVPCTSLDSSGCPYGTSCGDPDLPGFCSAMGAQTCTPWSSCSLGPGLAGTCVPDGTHTICLAVGQQSGDYGPCNPGAMNAQVAQLCRAGSVCQASALTLGQPAATGFCFPLCDLDGGIGDGGLCGAEAHCSQPSPDAYGVCLPGRPCDLWPSTCAVYEVCAPDSPDAFSGGCLPYGPDAGHPGAACTPPTSVVRESPCAGSACLPSDGGYACTPLCDLADGGQPYCHGQVCTPLSASDVQAVVGACR